MSKFDEAVALYQGEFDKLGVKFDADLLTKVAKGLGPSIYNDDASKVSSSDQSELDRVKEKFLMGKLGLADSTELDGAISDVVETLGKSNRNKYRAMFYYLLVEKFDKADIYN
ncbi:MAG: DUF2853 family protein [Flavobacteriales bacterium]|jgi:hypothetical protein|nr:DUF2853 family protein [Flavobacteriales bacterium]